MATSGFAAAHHYDILIREGSHPPYTMITDGTAVYPGLCLTGTGGTFPDVTVADAIGDNVCGIAGCLENQDIDTAYATNIEIPVYLTGHSAIVWGIAAPDNGLIEFGDILVCQTVETLGFVEPLKRAFKTWMAADSSTVLATAVNALFSLVGRAMETSASCATAEPLAIILSI